MCCSILLKATISRPFASPFAQNSYKWKRGENACTQALVMPWHATMKEQTLERPLSTACSACYVSPIHSTTTLVGGGQFSWPARCRLIPLSSACSHCTCGQARSTHSTRPTSEQRGSQLTRGWAKRSSKEGCCKNTTEQCCSVPPPEELPISHHITLQTRGSGQEPDSNS